MAELSKLEKRYLSVVMLVAVVIEIPCIAFLSCKMDKEVRQEVDSKSNVIVKYIWQHSYKLAKFNQHPK